MTQEIDLQKLHLLASQFIDGTSEGYKPLLTVYPSHIYSSLRRQMAVELAGKEVAKILDAADDAELASFRSGVARLYDGRQGVYAPVHDFWSFIEAILHVKKKELPELITAQNIEWTEEALPISQLQLTWMPFLERHQELFGPKPWSVAHLQQVFFQKPELFRRAKKEQRHVAGNHQHNFDQSEEPIVIVERNGSLELIDGNGRLYNYLIEGNETISCYKGILHGSMPTNYWVSAGILKQFCLEVRGYAEVDLEGFASGVSYLRTKLRSNVIALSNYELFLRNDFPEFEDSLQGILPPRDHASQAPQ